MSRSAFFCLVLYFGRIANGLAALLNQRNVYFRYNEAKICYILGMSQQVHNQGDTQDDNQSSTQVLDRVKTQEPSLYKVLLLNDDYTPMDFVTHILQKFFQKTKEEAENIMLQVHKEGRGLAGVFNFETAETKMHIVNTYAQQNKHPLQSIIEKES